MPKQVVVVGLGRLGSSVARELYQMGHDVLGIDNDERVAQEFVGQITYSVVGDATNETTLRELGVPNFDVAVVAVGSDLEASLMSTVLLKTMGLPYVVARANTTLHGQTLERLGADRVIYPEQETGVRLAHSLFHREIIEYMEVTSAFGISKIRPPDRMVGRTLEELEMAGGSDFKEAVVLAIRRGREPILAPSRDEVVQAGDILIVAGTEEALEKVRAL